MILRKCFLAMMVFAVVALSLNAKCNSDADIKAGARVSAQAAREFVKEVDSEVQSGDLDSATAESVKPAMNEIAAAADKVAEDQRDFNTLTSADKRHIVEDYLSYVTSRADGVEAALHIKSGQRKAKLEKIFGDIRHGISIAHIVESALPPPTPQPSPAQ
jgi:hypothetical protein